MKKDDEKYSFECECAGPGHCPVYGIRMGEKSYHKCKNDQSWRLHYLDFYKVAKEKLSKEEYDKREKQRETLIANQIELLKQKAKMKDAERELDEAIDKIEEKGITLENYEEKREGLGDLVSDTLSKLGFTEENIEKWSGIRGCGCEKRKKFLNKIMPFRKKE